MIIYVAQGEVTDRDVEPVKNQSEQQVCITEHTTYIALFPKSLISLWRR